MQGLSKPRTPKDCFRCVFIHFTMSGDLHVYAARFSVYRVVSCITLFLITRCFKRFNDVPSLHWYHPFDVFIILRNLRKVKKDV